MSLKKQVLKSRPVCKVTFRVSKEAADGAKTIYVVGDFNHWDENASPLKRLKSGEFTTTLELDTTREEYQFRYLYDSENWENEWEADGYADNGNGGENSIVKMTVDA